MAGPRKFDHDDARRRYAAGEKVAALALEYGVSTHAVYYVVSPQCRATQRAYSRQYQRDHRRVPCPGGCGALVWRRDGRIPLCPACTGATRRTAEHGTESRYSTGCKCDACREAARVAKAARRERRKVACTNCGKPRLHPNDVAAKVTDTGLCLDCYRGSHRQAA